MRRLFVSMLRVLAAAALFVPAFAAESSVAPTPGRKTMRIAGQWNLTAQKHEKTEMEGERTKLLTSTGKATLKHGPNLIRGPWDIDGKADVIQCDFVGKKFILSGSPVVDQKDKAGNVVKTITGQPGCVVEIDFAGGAINAKGPHTARIADGVPLAAPALAPAKDKEAPADKAPAKEIPARDTPK
jgi:hypothetical protein